MLHLLPVSSLPKFRIHLVPAESSVTDIRTGFTIYEQDQHRSVLHLQQLTTSLFLENDHDISFYAGLLERIADKPLTRQQTQEWLTDPLANLEHR
ncbi:hypothetical protein GCM10017790_01530 [Amycolatopsis oliviviridis]|uniref:DUF5753 domain-containing protein n=1 Tax=Amycolatopsis oliviviridis TaxID=1471590 RepID=A0ABQ3L490_9PSEU|nr:hypothetical protein GCM10017790_01530 [Amycolatopsis oliviviridis]